MRVGTHGLFRLCLKTFVAPFNSARLTAPGSPRMRLVVRSKKRKRTFDVCLDCLPLCHVQTTLAPIRTFEHSTSPRNQSAKHPDCRGFDISGLVIGSALSKGWRSGPEAFRAGHFLIKPETAHEKPLAPRVDCSVTDHRWRQNVVRTKKWRNA